MNDTFSELRPRHLATSHRVGLVDLWQARTMTNVFLFVAAAVLATNYFDNVAIWFLVCCTTIAVSLGRFGLLVVGLPIAVVANRLIGGQFARGWSVIQVSDVFVAGLVLAFVAICYARLELGTTLALPAEATRSSRTTEGERYRLRVNLGLLVSPLIAVLVSLLILRWLPFRNISPNNTGLIRSSTRMLILVWGLGSLFLIFNALFRWIMWRRQSPMQGRMYVLQTLGDCIGGEQLAIERKRNTLAVKRARKAESSGNVTFTRRDDG
jgi:hypothetical protein